MPRKRARDEAELDLSAFEELAHENKGQLWQLRNMWQFANLMQYLFIFGKIVKVDEDIDVEELEDICMNPERQGRLAEMGLALLKYVSSHRGLTPDIFDEYTRRQYLAKAPQRNPYGDEEEPTNFADLDIFTRIKILQQLSVWTLGNAERIRSQMEEKDSEQTQWRIEPFGWDSDDRTYFLLDDDRLYRQTDAPLPPTPVKAKAKPKAKSKPRSKPTRSSKRQKLLVDSDDDEDTVMSVDEPQPNGEAQEKPEELDDTLGGMKWECIAVTMDEYQDFLESIRRSRDANEKALHKSIINTVMPILEKRAEAQRQKALRKQREWENAQKMMTAKRSSRIADKAEKQREVEEAAEVERKRREDLRMAHRIQQRQQKMEEDRESRMQTREQRLNEREARRILHEEELQKLEELKARGEDEESRHSSRNLENELERRTRELAALKEQEEEDKWIFDCSGCGLHGENVDDGTHSIACDRCNIWQHSKCNGIKEEDAEKEDFSFVCGDCKRKEEDAKKPKIPPLKLGRIGASDSPDTERAAGRPSSSHLNGSSPATPGIGRIVEGVSLFKREPSTTTTPESKRTADVLNGPSLTPGRHQAGPTGQHIVGQPSVGHPQQPWQGTSLPSPRRVSPANPTPYLPNGTHLQHQPHYQQHQMAHTSAVAASGLHHQQSPQLHGHQPSWAPPIQARSSQPPSSYMNTFSTQRPMSSNGINGTAMSPVKQARPYSPAQPTPGQPDRGSPLPGTHTLHQPSSPYHNLSPPPNSAAQQRKAGQSPMKQPSPSPPPPYRHQQPLFQSSPSMPPPTATPSNQIASATSPASSFFQPTPKVTTSPIPPIGDGPVIPQKHDPTRPPSRDHAGEVPVFPPVTSLSPSRLPDGKGMGTQAGEGGLGTGGIPVKKLPGQGSSPVQPAAMLGLPNQSNGHGNT